MIPASHLSGGTFCLPSDSHNTNGDKAMNQESLTPRLLTVVEVAERLGVKPSTIRAWIMRREKLEFVKVGRCIRITERSVQKFIDDNTVTPRS